jgi:hypothetical protein
MEVSWLFLHLGESQDHLDPFAETRENSSNQLAKAS